MFVFLFIAHALTLIFDIGYSVFDFRVSNDQIPFILPRSYRLPSHLISLPHILPLGLSLRKTYAWDPAHPKLRLPYQGPHNARSPSNIVAVLPSHLRRQSALVI